MAAFLKCGDLQEGFARVRCRDCKREMFLAFSRAGRGSLSVTDQVELKEAKAFETALVTFSQWQRAAPNRLIIGSGDGAVSVEIDTRGKPFEIVSEEITEDLPGGQIPVRLAVRLVEPVTSAEIGLQRTAADQ